MDEQKVPYIVFEGEQARHERTAKRLVIALIISITLLFATNLMRNYGRSYEGGMSNRRYSSDGYYYDDGGMSNRRGRAANGRFVSRDGSDMARKLREMMNEAPDDSARQELQRLADKMEQM